MRSRGNPHGRVAYGFGRTHDDRGDFATQFVDEQQASVVRDIFTSVAGGESIRSIRNRLTSAGVPTPRGADFWHPGTVTGIVRNPVYRPHPADPTRGCRTHHGELLEDAPGAWQPLVTEVIWQTANRVLGVGDHVVRRQRRTSAPGAIKYLLSGNRSVMSAPCGSQLVGTSWRSGRQQFYACRFDKCVSAPMVECDECVTRLVVARLSRRDARQLWSSDDSAAREARDELARLRADLDENEREYRTGAISARLAGARERELKPLIEDAERRGASSGVPVPALGLLNVAKVSSALVRPTWNALPVTARRQVIADLFSSLVLGPITARITRWTPADERLAIVAERIEHEWRSAFSNGRG